MNTVECRVQRAHLPHEQCRKAVQPSAFHASLAPRASNHIQCPPGMQKFIDKLGWKYDSRTVSKFPPDGSKPQPTIPWNDGIECQLCAAESRDRPFRPAARGA